MLPFASIYEHCLRLDFAPATQQPGLVVQQESGAVKAEGLCVTGSV